MHVHFVFLGIDETASRLEKHAVRLKTIMQFGICCHPKSLKNEASGFAENVAFLKNAGVDYLEFPIAALSPEGDESDWEVVQNEVVKSHLPVAAFNGFLPVHQRITGPEVDLSAVLEYSRIALERCHKLGGDVVVLGSGKARRAPAGFDLSRAERQFIEFCRELAPIAQHNRITICIEPLNAREDNLICSVAHGAKIVDEVAKPSIRLLADFYHMMEENEPLENVVAAGGRLRHTHLADIGRVVPGTAESGEADFKGFFRALKDAGYAAGSTPGASARCSFEGNAENILQQAAPMMRLLHERFEAA
jgi:sugar phosphate isomerase/epimerase